MAPTDASSDISSEKDFEGQQLRGSNQSRWRIVWCHERSHKQENEDRRQAIRKTTVDLGCSFACLKKARQYSLWIERASRPPYVLITDWREAQPCTQVIAQHTGKNRPVMTVVVCELPKQYGRACEWAKNLPLDSNLGPIHVCERSNVPQELLGGLVREFFGGPQILDESAPPSFANAAEFGGPPGLLAAPPGLCDDFKGAPPGLVSPLSMMLERQYGSPATWASCSGQTKEPMRFASQNFDAKSDTSTNVPSWAEEDNEQAYKGSDCSFDGVYDGSDERPQSIGSHRGFHQQTPVPFVVGSDCCPVRGDERLYQQTHTQHSPWSSWSSPSVSINPVTGLGANMSQDDPWYVQTRLSPEEMWIAERPVVHGSPLWVLSPPIGV